MKELRFVPPLVLVLFVLGGYPAFELFYKTTDNIKTSALLTIAYGVFGLVISFLTKVWLKLEGKWSDRFADWLDRTFQSTFSKFRHDYLEYMVYQHRVFDVKGLTTQGPYNLELEKVYVQLGVDPTSPHELNQNPIQKLPETLRSGSHTIWEYITNKNVQENNYAILGAPGSGKTTLLKHMALTLASPKHRRREAGAPDLFPILLFIRDHAQSIKENSNMTLAQLIRDQFTNRHAPLPPIGWLEGQLKRGTCLIMLDGLDEIADELTRKLVVEWVDQCMVSCGKNRFILSSRPFGYRSNPLANVSVLQIRPFSTRQVEQFVHNWYIANEVMSSQKDDPGVREDARSGADDLLDRLRSSSTLSDLAVNPLLLTMIATVHRYRSSLPGRRVELYAEICEVFLGKRQEARGLVQDLTPAQKIRVLRQLAHFMMQKEAREIDAGDVIKVIHKPLASVSPKMKEQEFINNVETRSGLFVEIETGKYGFSHLTFQEYLTSLHIIENRLENELMKEVDKPWWRETIRLYCAQSDASQMIAACLNSINTTALSLAIECMNEAREVNSETREQYQKVMDKGLEVQIPRDGK